MIYHSAVTYFNLGVTIYPWLKRIWYFRICEYDCISLYHVSTYSFRRAIFFNMQRDPCVTLYVSHKQSLVVVQAFKRLIIESYIALPIIDIYSFWASLFKSLDELFFHALDLRRPQVLSIAHDFLAQDKYLNVCMSYEKLMRSIQENETMNFY